MTQKNSLIKKIIIRMLMIICALVLIWLTKEGILPQAVYNIIFFCGRKISFIKYIVAGILSISLGAFCGYRMLKNMRREKKGDIITNEKTKDEYFMFGKKRFRHENNGNYGIVGVGTLISIMLIVWGIYIIIKAFEKHTNFYIPSNIYEIIGDVALFSIAFMVWYFGYIFNNGINGRLTDLQPISGRCIYVEKIEYGKKEKYKPYYEYYVGTVYFLHEEEIKYPAKKATTVNSTKMLYYCSKRKAVITKEEFKRNRKIKVSGIILCLLCFVAIIQDLIRF